VSCDGVFEVGERRGEGGGRLYRCCGELVSPAGFEGLETTLEFVGPVVNCRGGCDSVSILTGDSNTGGNWDGAGAGPVAWEGVKGACRLLTMKVLLCYRLRG
jgi:hypothetical protein